MKQGGIMFRSMWALYGLKSQDHQMCEDGRDEFGSLRVSGTSRKTSLTWRYQVDEPNASSTHLVIILIASSCNVLKDRIFALIWMEFVPPLVTVLPNDTPLPCVFVEVPPPQIQGRIFSNLHRNAWRSCSVSWLNFPT